MSPHTLQPGFIAASSKQPTAGEHSSDEILIERIAAGDELAMQVLFARHRTNIYGSCGSSATRPSPMTS
jgi:hypothetical protein